MNQTVHKESQYEWVSCFTNSFSRLIFWMLFWRSGNTRSISVWSNWMELHHRFDIQARNPLNKQKNFDILSAKKTKSFVHLSLSFFLLFESLIIQSLSAEYFGLSLMRTYCRRFHRWNWVVLQCVAVQCVDCRFQKRMLEVHTLFDWSRQSNNTIVSCTMKRGIVLYQSCHTNPFVIFQKTNQIGMRQFIEYDTNKNERVDVWLWFRLCCNEVTGKIANWMLKFHSIQNVRRQQMNMWSRNLFDFDLNRCPHRMYDRKWHQKLLNIFLQDRANTWNQNLSLAIKSNYNHGYIFISSQFSYWKNENNKSAYS